MVHYFTSEEGLTIYKGRDKYENEELLRYHFPEDVWFHVDDLSSAHVYLRMPEGMAFESIPEALLEQCCQLVKDNSIEGCKRHDVAVVYTPAGNVLKRPDHDIGQVSFRDEGKVRRVKHVPRNKDLLKALNRTFREQNPDLQQQLLERERSEERAKLKALKEAEQIRKDELKEQQRLKEEMSYDRLWDEGLVQSNLSSKPDDDDFM